MGQPRSKILLSGEEGVVALLLSSVDQAGEGVVITDSHFNVLHVNPAFERISGYSMEEIVDRDFATLVEPGREEASPMPDREVLAADGAWTGRWVIKRKDGNRTRLRARIKAVKDSSENVIYFVAHCQEVTGENAIGERILRSQKAEALGTLAGGIAHAFNNILSTIVVNTEMAIQDGEKTGTAHPSLLLALQAAHRGRDLVKRIIEFRGQTAQAPAPLRLTPILKEALIFLRSSLPSHIEIREQFDAQPDIILGDPSQIHQILINLGNNAAYAMREEGGLLEVKLSSLNLEPAMAAGLPDLEPGPYLRLTVRDTGEGMPPEVMERIFDPFFTTKTAGEGMGLGLSVVQEIVRRSGGTVTVYSEVGQGSTFQVFFPRAESPPKEKQVSPWAFPPGKKRILLVEDEELQLRSYQGMLERMGYRVTPHASSQEALSAFEADPDDFNLVITDQTMPKMTGVKLVEAILAIRPDIPVILCTGFSETLNAEDAKRKGVWELVMKPFSISEMAVVIRRALKEPTSPRE